MADAIRHKEDELTAPARGTFGGNAQGRRYGFRIFSDYFTDRQLVALTTFCELISEVHENVRQEALGAGLVDGVSFEEGGDGAHAYADAVSTYVAMAVSRLSDYMSSLTTWASNPQMEILRNSFSRQAISMTWDFGEGNPFAESSGSLTRMVNVIARALERLGSGVSGMACQRDASEAIVSGYLISTDPPYYDNIVYSDLADFFYVWLRKMLGGVYPGILSTVLTPKTGELVANAYRHGGKDGARRFFENGFSDVFRSARRAALEDYPTAVYYAFKQAEISAQGESSIGWETLLEGVVREGWAVTATWPVRSESAGRMVSVGTNTLSSSIVLALRPRGEGALRVDRRGFVAALKDELPQRLWELQQGAIAPVDLPQAAVGPGMAVFSRYSAVLEDDGNPMRVRTALARINEVLDEVLSEQEGDFDPDTRFALAWFRQHGFESGPFGAADGRDRRRRGARPRDLRLAAVRGHHPHH